MMHDADVYDSVIFMISMCIRFNISAYLCMFSCVLTLWVGIG